MTKLLDNVSVDTVGDPIQGDGGSKQISVWATDYGGGEVAIEISPDNGTTWNTLIYNGSPAVFSSNIDIFLFKFAQAVLMRAVLSGSSGAINVNADIYQ
jgi:hypothetical protein